MTRPAKLTITDTDLDALAESSGHIVVFAGEDGKLDAGAKRVNRLTKGALARFVESDKFAKAKQAGLTTLSWPAGIAAEAVHIVRLDTRAPDSDARKAGVAIGKAAGASAVTILAGSRKHADQIALGTLLRIYEYADQKTSEDEKEHGAVTMMCLKPDEVSAATADHDALVSGVFFTRDLVSAPANVLTTTSFADQLSDLGSLGLDVEILDEDALEKLGMRCLLAVGQGSASPSKVAIMRWNGGGDAAPFALVGKGVVFDTGGISLKPAGGMEDMTMDMGGAGVVSGVMKTLAMRKARANVVGLVGLVENMPSSTATRPGDVVASMKGDTVEIINTDAEGRLVLCDVMWYAQDRFKPQAMIDLATLTGAIIIGLGHDNAGVFSNDDALCDAFLGAAKTVGEGAWRMPLGKPYADLLKSNIADLKNVGGRAAGSITAAEFLHRFVKDDTPWCHLDIAGVASTKSDSPHAPKGASGWGVMALDQLIRDRFEG